MVAAAAATFALAALLWPDRRTAAHSTARGAWASIVVLAGLFGYVLLLGVWTRIFPEEVWSRRNGGDRPDAHGPAVGAAGMYAVARVGCARSYVRW